MEFKIGQTVEAKLDQGRSTHRGVIRYIGEIAVASQEGDFLGLELSTPTGKNDGSVRGERYFQCTPLHGLFVRPQNISRIISQPAPKPAPKAATKTAAPKTAASSSKPRPSSISATKSSTQSSRLSIVGPPKSIATQPRAPSVAKTPTQSASVSSSTQPQRPTSTSIKPSAPTPTQTKRQSSVGTAFTALRASRKPSISSATSSEARPAAPSTASTSTVKTAGTRQVPETEWRRLQKLQADSAELEKQNQDLQVENEKVKNILTKLQSKCQQYHHDNTELKENNRFLKSENEEQAKAIQERDSMVELATIDKEMAEEQKEQLEAELENEKALNEELRLELEINQEEASFITEDMPEDQKQAALLRQAQGERDRYREGIVRLRDMTREQIKDLEARIRELEAQAAHTETVEIELATANAKIVKLEAVVDDLQEQVDASNEWEDMHVELIEQKNNLEESLSQLQLERRELSTIIEVSQETIQDFAEHADELQSEIESKDAQLAQATQELQERDYESAQLKAAIAKYHDALLEAESDRREAAAKHIMSEQEMKEVTDRFNEAMEKNRHMRTAHLNNINKTITAELSKHAASEATEELAIMKSYLPNSAASDAYMSQSLRAYFLAKKIDYKAALACKLLGITELYSSKSAEQNFEDIYRVETLRRLRYTAHTAELYWTTATSSDMEYFRQLGFQHDDMLGVDKTLDGAIELIRTGETNFKSLLESTRGAHKVMTSIWPHAFETHDRMDAVLIYYAGCLYSSLNAIRFQSELVKAFTQHFWEVNLERQGDIQPALDTASNFIRSVMQSTAVAEKFHKVLEDLQNDGLYPDFPEGIQEIKDTAFEFEVLAKQVKKSAESFIKDTLSNFEETPFEVTAETLQAKIGFALDLRSVTQPLATCFTKLGSWHSFSSVLLNTAEIENVSPPWAVKAEEIEATRMKSLEAEKNLQLLATEHHNTLLLVRSHEELIETKNLEIEHLAGKNVKWKTKSAKFEELEGQLKQAKVDLEHYKAEVNKQAREIEDLRWAATHERVEEPLSPDLQRVDRPSHPIVAEEPPTQTQMAGAFVTFVKALTDENHWLRQRENAELLENNLQAVFSKSREQQAKFARADSRHRQARADDMLSMSLDLNDIGAPAKPMRFYANDNDFLDDEKRTPGWKSTPLPPSSSHRSGQRSARRVPLRVAPVHIRTAPTQSLLAHDPMQMEDMAFMDLSPVAEDFESETFRRLEDFSEVILNPPAEAESRLEDFSEMGLSRY